MKGSGDLSLQNILVMFWKYVFISRKAHLLKVNMVPNTDLTYIYGLNMEFIVVVSVVKMSFSVVINCIWLCCQAEAMKMFRGLLNFRLFHFCSLMSLSVLSEETVPFRIRTLSLLIRRLLDQIRSKQPNQFGFLTRSSH